MLTYDDLDHFDEQTMARLFASHDAQEEAQVLKRRERILACLRFCRDVGFEELPEAGLQTARRLLKRALRCQQRSRRSQPEVIGDFLEGALRALGESGCRQEEAAEVAALRHLLEREIEAAALAHQHGDTRLPLLLEALALGQFEIGAESELGALDEALSKFNGRAEIDLEIILDGDSCPSTARAHLVITCGLWRWSALDGCSVAFDDGDPLPLLVSDALLPVLLAGVATQGGRAATIWAKAMHAHPASHHH